MTNTAIETGLCPMCGTPVKIVGETTMHYEPLNMSYSEIEKVLEEVKTGEDIYPSSVFIPPTKEYLHEVHILLKEHFGTGIDGISAHCMKYARDIALADIKEAIKKELL